LRHSLVKVRQLDQSDHAALAENQRAAL
jgi:hypothetical protein